MGVVPSPAVIAAGLFVIGAFAGRWLTVAIERFPRHERLADQLRALKHPQQFCRACSHPGTWLTRLPILGWLLTRGRCPACQRRRPLRPVLVQLVTAILFAVIWALELSLTADFVISDSVLHTQEGPPGPDSLAGLWHPLTWLTIRCLLHLLMICGLIVATFIDLEHRIIPDGSTVPLMLLAVLVSFAVGQVYIVPLWFQDASVAQTLKPLLPPTVQPLIFYWHAQPFAEQYPHWHGLLVSLAGLVVGAGSVWLVRLIGFWVMKQEAMGFGDVVLMAMIGSVIGWQPVLAVFFIAPMLAVFAAAALWLTRRDREIPYGPWLSLATVVLLVGWQQIWPFAKRIFDMGPVLLLMAVSMAVSLAVILQFVQLVKRLLGLEPAGPETEDVWTSADHLAYYNGGSQDREGGRWPGHRWPGTDSGRGVLQHQRWRHGR